MKILNTDEFVNEKLGIKPINKDRLEDIVHNELPYNTFKAKINLLIDDLKKEVEQSEGEEESMSLGDFDLRFPYNNEIFQIPNSEKDIEEIWDKILVGFEMDKFEKNEDGDPATFVEAWLNYDLGVGNISSDPMVNYAINIVQKKDGRLEVTYVNEK